MLAIIEGVFLLRNSIPRLDSPPVKSGRGYLASNFYLTTPLKRPEFIHISINNITKEIIIQYKIRDIADSKGMVYTQVNRGMYGLPQSGLLTNELLERRLNKRVYHHSKLVPGLWCHTWHTVQFTLLVDDFEKEICQRRTHTQSQTNLQRKLQNHARVGRTAIHRHHLRLGLQAQTSLFIHAWIHKKALKQFKHNQCMKQHQPYPSAIIKYGAKKQYATPQSTSLLLDKHGKKFIQQVCGNFLFLGQVVRSTLLCPISAISSQAGHN